MSEQVVPMRTPAKKRAERPLWASPDAPLDVARRIYGRYRRPGGRTLVHWRGDWMRWTGQAWAELDHAALRSNIYSQLGRVDYLKPVRKGGEIVDYERTPWNPNRNKVANVLEALAAVAYLDSSIDPPEWIADYSADGPAHSVIACRNGLLSLRTRELHPHTPALFNLASVPFDYDPDAPPPREWLKFLNTLWPNDGDSIALLQEWMGYIVSGRTDQQKIMMLIGPPRSGKGSIARVLTQLIGVANTTAPVLASFAGNFGLAPLLGKTLAVIGDARLGGRDANVIVERLLSISGEDLLTVDRKFRDPWVGKLPTRLMILSNEVPRFNDASGAIANRLIVLQTRKSFLGREDATLSDRLLAELPGILNWALEGLDRLTSKRRFTVPSASRDATSMLMDLASPVSAFIRERCVTGPDHRVERDRLYDAWKAWCLDSGHEPGSRVTFGRNLAAAVPDLGTAQPRSNGGRVRLYLNIGLDPVPPVPSGETAGQSSGDPVPHPVPKPVPDPVPGDQPVDPPPSGTGGGTGSGDVKPQVKASGTGGTGFLPFKSQLAQKSDPEMFAATPAGQLTGPAAPTPLDVAKTAQRHTKRTRKRTRAGREVVRCPDCRRAPARHDTGRCDWCSVRVTANTH